MRSIKELSNLEGRAAILTGGAGHIGEAVAETLLELGAQVVIIDREKTSTEKRARDLEGRFKKGAVHPMTVELEDETQTRKSIQEAIQKLGRLDCLIHCAAYTGTTKMHGWQTSFEKQGVDAWDAALRVNMTSAFIMAQEAKEALKKSGHGNIILFSSIYGMVGPDMSLYEGTEMSNSAAYNAAKGGLIQLTRYLSTVFAPEIRVNAIAPGGVWRNQPDAFHERYKKRTPLKRMANEEDLKGAIAYLASDLSSYVTGQNIPVDGGWTTW